MSCEVAKSPLYEPGANAFDSTNGQKTDDNNNVQADETINLSPISEFNTNFNDLPCIDPQNLSNAGSPSYNPNTTLTPDFTTDTYPQEFASTPGSPYFHSIEHALGGAAPSPPPSFIPPHLSNHHQHLHRRSVSEPPDSSLMHYNPHHPHQHPHPQNHGFPQQASPVIFHRDGHNLGTPRSAVPAQKKTKQTRSQPYRSHQQERPQRHPTQSRYHLRRAYTQHSERVPPTSAPVYGGMNMNVGTGMGVGVHTAPLQQGKLHHPQPTTPIDRNIHFVSSRVCTPVPEPSPAAVMGVGIGVIDPFLATTPALPAASLPAPAQSHTAASAGLPPHGNATSECPRAGAQANGICEPGTATVARSGKSVVIYLGVEELRGLIGEAVREGLKGWRLEGLREKGEMEGEEERNEGLVGLGNKCEGGEA